MKRKRSGALPGAGQARKQVDDLRMILKICHEMMVQSDLDRLLGLIISSTSEILDAERTSIFVVDPATNELWSRVAQDSEIREIRMPASRGIAGHVAMTREIVNIRNAYKDPRFNQEIDRKTGYVTRTILCAPMINHENQVIGVIQALNKRRRSFTKYDESLAAALAAQAAVAIENAQLYLDRELTLKSALKAIGELVDARDPVTAGHSDRVARYSVALGRTMGMTEKELKALEYAAELHDIGKIGVRDKVLLKHGKLTPEEYLMIQEHVRITQRTLEQIHFSRELKEVPAIAGAHHERLDGSGYPRGLKGAEISRAARIIAITDVYDALVSYDRPYKRALAPEEALGILEKSQGTLYDATILDRFRQAGLHNLERRDYQRISADLAIEYTVIAPENRSIIINELETRATNVSASGLMFTAREILPTGTYLDMIVHLPDVNFGLIGKVVRSVPAPDHTSYGIGVCFVNMTNLVRERLAKYLVEVVAAG